METIDIKEALKQNIGVVEELLSRPCPIMINPKKGEELEITDYITSGVFIVGYRNGKKIVGYTYSIGHQSSEVTLNLLTKSWFSLTLRTEGKRIFITQNTWDHMDTYIYNL